MKLFKRGKILRTEIVIALGVVAFLSLFVYMQYKSYSGLPKLNRANYYYTAPVNHVDDVPIHWQYFSVNYENLDATKSPEEQFKITVYPHFEHKVYYASQKDLTLKSLIATNSLDKAKQSAGNRYEEFFGSYPIEKALVIERRGDSFRPNTAYTITIRQKSFNLISYLTNSYSLSYTFKTSTKTDNEDAGRVRSFFSSLGSFMSTVPTKENLERQKKYKEVCQIEQLETDYLFGYNGKPERDTIDGKYYDVVDFECDTVNFTGETVTVVLKDPRGKAEFEQFLKDNNVNLKLLKITYKNQ